MVIYNVCVCVCLCSLMWILDEVMRTTDLHNIIMQNMITDATWSSWLTNNTAADCLICVLICTIQPVHLVMSA